MPENFHKIIKGILKSSKHKSFDGYCGNSSDSKSELKREKNTLLGYIQNRLQLKQNLFLGYPEFLLFQVW